MSYEQFLEKKTLENAAPTETVSLFNTLMECATMRRPGHGPDPPAVADMEMYRAAYKGIPQLHEDFVKAAFTRMHYSQMDVYGCKALLKKGYEANRALWQFDLMLSDEKLMRNYRDDICLIKRFGNLSEEVLDWFENARPFDVIDVHSKVRYADSFHSFTNCKSKTEILTMGKTHVAIGFVDLSPLLWSEWSVDLSTPRNKPLSWIGYEQSPYNCAKTRVIIDMMNRSCSPKSILEVWFSSVWSKETAGDFYRSVKKVLCFFASSSFSSSSEVDGESVVKEILKLWSQTEGRPVPLKTAREEWLAKASAGSLSMAFNALSAKDQRELALYCLTGQVYDGGECASTTMFRKLPYDLIKSHRSLDENFLHGIDSSSLFQTATHNSQSIMDAARTLLTYRVENLIRSVKNKEVQMEVHVGKVCLSNPALLNSISAHRPYTISWNNVLDYIPRVDFHRIAKLCSAPEDTIHFGYSMNWPQRMAGAMSIDYPGGSHMKERLKLARQAETMSSVFSGWGRYFRCPLLTNPINTLDFIYFTRGYKHWAEFFLQGINNVLTVTPPILGGPTQRVDSVIYLTWSYDEKITPHFKTADTL
eukprot:Nk52_evm66s151 gene=Nk52_evmTU66s151